jgi:putative protease
MIELSTNISNYEQLVSTDISSYDAIYLGDVTCPLYPNNFCSNLEDLKKAVDYLRKQDKKCYLRLYAVPENKDMLWMKGVILKAIELKVDAFEVHNLGVLMILKEVGNKIPLHFGVFGNIYTIETIKVLQDYGVSRVQPSPELSIEEAIFIKDETPIETTFAVHGKIPLVASETCFIMEQNGNDESDCGFACSKDHWLTRQQGEWSMKDTGRMTLSGKDLCMVEHIEDLIKKGVKNFYVQSHGESSEFIETTGQIYKEVISKALDQEEIHLGDKIADLIDLAHEGICNGYYFGSTGSQYHGRDL